MGQTDKRRVNVLAVSNLHTIIPTGKGMRGIVQIVGEASSFVRRLRAAQQ